jgi:hypothetical protein
MNQMGVIDQNSGKRENRKTLKRSPADQLPPLRLGQHDLETIYLVYLCRALTTDQIAVHLFPSAAGRTYCRERLRRLYDHGYLDRDEQPVKLSEGRKPLVYFLDKRGADLLKGQGLWHAEVDWKPAYNQVKPGYIEHLLRTNDVRLATTRAALRSSFTIEKWLDDRTLRSSQMKDYVTITGPEGAELRAAVIPDGFFQLGQYNLTEGNEKKLLVSTFLLEIDLGTVVGLASRFGRRDWQRKILAYLEYFRSGLCQERYGTNIGRVLTVTTSGKRLKTLKTVTENAGGRKRFWFSTFDLIEKTNNVLLDPIWQKASHQGLFSLAD